MKIETQTFVVVGLQDQVSADSLLSEKMPKRGCHIYLPWPSEEFTRLLECSKLLKLSVSCRFSVEKNENAQVSWYAMEPDSFCPTTEKDEKWIESVWDSLPFMANTRNVRHFRDYRITKLRHQSKKIVSPGGSFYFVPEEIIANFERYGFTGMSWGDIRDHKTDTKYSTHRLLIPCSLIGPSELNPSSLWRLGSRPESIGRDYLITYAGIRTFSARTLKDAKDFNLTMELLTSIQN